MSFMFKTDPCDNDGWPCGVSIENSFYKSKQFEIKYEMENGKKALVTTYLRVSQKAISIMYRTRKKTQGAWII